MLPKHKAEFESLMNSIDGDLSAQGLPIHARAFQAGFEAQRHCGVQHVTFGPRIHSVSMRGYTAENLVDHVQLWYQERYGDRIKVDPSPGTFVMQIRDDLWRVRLPLIYGRFQVLALRPKDLHSVPRDPVPVQNALDLIVDLTPTLRDSLTNTELTGLMVSMKRGWTAINYLAAKSSEAFIQEARGDLRAAVEHMMSTPIHYGQSRWSSLQMTEKVLKSLLPKQGPVPHTHDLDRLIALLGGDFQAKIDPADLATIQCSADVRYDTAGSDKIGAHRAHDAALEICRTVAEM